MLENALSGMKISGGNNQEASQKLRKKSLKREVSVQIVVRNIFPLIFRPLWVA